MEYKTRLPGRWQKAQRDTAFVHVSAASVDAGQAVAENGDYVKASLGICLCTSVHRLAELPNSFH